MVEAISTLIVDDEEKIRLVLQETLKRVGHTVTTAANGEEALDLLRKTGFDVILLDLRLGGAVDGQRVLEAVRWRWPATVVVMMTGHGSLESAVAAIQEGVDGYLLKPVKPDEVRRAVEEARRRRQELLNEGEEEEEEEDHLVRGGPFVLDLKRYTAACGDEPLDLSARELKLLAHLIENAPEAISAKELVWVVRDYRPEHEYEARDIIKWYIYRLRRKVEPDPSEPRHVVNVRGVGYRFAE